VALFGPWYEHTPKIGAPLYTKSRYCAEKQHSDKRKHRSPRFDLHEVERLPTAPHPNTAIDLSLFAKLIAKQPNSQSKVYYGEARPGVYTWVCKNETKTRDHIEEAWDI